MNVVGSRGVLHPKTGENGMGVLVDRNDVFGLTTW